jgi:hypothetical protein
MIITYLGGVGSGKSLSVVKSIVDKKQYCFTNFKLKNLKGKYHRLRFDDIINDSGDEKERISSRRFSVNWDFWDRVREKHKSFSIYLDEIHNLIHARSSMSTHNKLMSKWVSQIRKITSDSEYNHLYIISQKIRKIDVDFRELAHIYIECNKLEIGKKVYIIHTFYEGIENYEIRKKSHRSYFLANPYFRYFDSKEIIKFGDSEEYI